MREILTYIFNTLVCTLILAYGYSQDLSFREIAHPKDLTVQHGDLIFQTSLSNQSQAIQLATNSPYSHVGLVCNIAGELFVLEAVQAVKLTKLGEWIVKGKDGHFVVKRLKNAREILNDEVFAQMQAISEECIGKDYDLYFDWSDDQMYCSELVWKVYYRATGIEIGHLSPLSSFDVSNDLVRNALKERYGDDIPWDEMLISPAAMFNSERLIEVLEF